MQTQMQNWHSLGVANNWKAPKNIQILNQTAKKLLLPQRVKGRGGGEGEAATAAVAAAGDAQECNIGSQTGHLHVPRRRFRLRLCPQHCGASQWCECFE